MSNPLRLIFTNYREYADALAALVSGGGFSTPLATESGDTLTTESGDILETE